MDIRGKLHAFSFSRNKEFLTNLFRLAIPMILQNLVMALMNIIDVVMIGQMGEVAIAAVGISGQAVFLMSMFMIGMNTGTATMISQNWGARNMRAIRSLMGIALLFSTGAALIFFVIGRFFPKAFLGIYSEDPAVLEAGAQYMSIVAFSYLVYGISRPYATAHRATESVKLPTATGILAIFANTFFNYCLIGGNLGFPRLGIQGAALSTVIACSLELTVLLGVTYIRKMTPAARLSEFKIYRKGLMADHLKIALPVVAGELFWGLGEAQFQIVYARMGTAIVAGMSIFSSVERITSVAIGGVANSTAILVGKRIGEGDKVQAESYAKRCMVVTGMLGVCLLTGLFFARGAALTLFNVSEEVKLIAFNVLAVYCFVGFFRYMNYTSIAGVLRGGGDTKFGMYIDTIPLWLCGVPLAYLCGLVLHWPAHMLYWLFTIEQATKLALGLNRMRNKKWIHDLVRRDAAETAETIA